MSEEKNIPGENSKEESVNEISQKETIEQTQTTNQTSEIQKSEIENMEVHHHRHVEKKNFKEYFLEFLMIFLAVTMGFFAENIRERFAEEKTTQQYLESLQVELNHNKKVYYAADSLYKSRLPVEDSIVKIFLAKKENADLLLMARLISTSRGQYAPAIETSAYNQLVNSGGLKYIDNELKDSLSKYESLIEGFKTYNTIVNNYMITAFPDITSIEDLSDYINYVPNQDHVFTMSPYPELTEMERREITNYYTYHFVRTQGNMENIEDLITAQTSLLTMIQKEIEDH